MHFAGGKGDLPKWYFEVTSGDFSAHAAIKFFISTHPAFLRRYDSVQVLRCILRTNITINTPDAPNPVGAYPHARRVGDLLFLSGVGPRQPRTNAIPGGPICDENGAPRDYDIEAQTQAVIDNVRVILEAAGSSLDKVIDITAFLVDMDRDFKGYNKVYKQTFEPIQATRTTVAITALPTPIAVEFKVLALA